MAGMGGHPWQGVCMAWGMHGKGECVAKGVVRGKDGGAWQERRPLQQTVRILLEYILVSLYIDGTISSLCRAE